MALLSPSPRLLSLCFSLGLLGACRHSNSQERELTELDSERHDLTSEASLRDWATLDTHGVSFTRVNEGLRLEAQKGASLRALGALRRVRFTGDNRLRIASAEGAVRVAVGYTGSASFRSEEVSVAFRANETDCITHAHRNGREGTSLDSQASPCRLDPSVSSHELVLRLYSVERSAASSLDGKPLSIGTIDWMPTTPVQPWLDVQWDGPGVVVLQSAAFYASPKEFLERSFDETFKEASLSDRWLAFKGNTDTMEETFVAGGPTGLQVKARARGITDITPVTTVQSRQFPLRNVRVSARVDVRKLTESATVLRLSGESYWKRAGIDVGIMDVKGSVGGYCTGNWDGKLNVEGAPHAFLKPTTVDLGEVEFAIEYDPKTREARTFIDGNLACHHVVDIPPYISVNMMVGGNLHNARSDLDYAVRKASYHAHD
jgi:hypothetical protein